MGGGRRSNNVMEALQEQNAYLREQLRREQEAHAETRKVIAVLAHRIPELGLPLEPPDGIEMAEEARPTQAPTVVAPAEGPATRHAAAAAVLSIVLAGVFALLLGGGDWVPYSVLLGICLLLILSTVRLDWLAPGWSRSYAWSAAFALCCYVTLAYPLALTLSLSPDWSRQDSQDTGWFFFLGILLTAVFFYIGVRYAKGKTPTG